MLKPGPKPRLSRKATPSPSHEPKPEAKAGVATLLNTSLGDLLVAGLVKDPEDAGRIIAAAIVQADTPDVVAKAPETKVEPKAEPKPPPNRGQSEGAF